MNLMPLADLLETATLGVKGDTLFLNMMPTECEQGILLRNHLAGTIINYELPGYFKTGFQVIVRSGDYQTGENLIKAVSDALTMEEQQVGPMFFKYMRPHALPVSFPLSKGNLVEFNVNFDVCFNE